MSFIVNDLYKNLHNHCSIDPLNETCEKFFQIWSHKAVNLSNDLIEYTIQRMQSDRLRHLFQTRNEYTHRQDVTPFCPISLHIEDDLQRIKEHIRRFCLTTRNVYRHLRSDSRIYPQMSISLDKNIMMKICRFIFKTKALIEIYSKEKHLNNQKSKIKQNENNLQVNDPFNNITKAFIALQSNFEILHGDILERDFFQNAKTAVQTLPIILDTSRTIRLIFCTLYKLNEPERQAEAKAIRQRRLGFCVRKYRTKKPQALLLNLPIKTQHTAKFKTIDELLKMNHSQITPTSTSAMPTKNLSVPSKIFSHNKSKKTESSKRIHSSKSQSNTSIRKVSKISTNHLSPSTSKRSHVSSKKSSSSIQKQESKTKSSNSVNKKQKISKNKNALATDSTLSNEYNGHAIKRHYNNILKKFKNIDSSSKNQISDKEKLGWTTWSHNAIINRATISSSNNINLITNNNL